MSQQLELDGRMRHLEERMEALSTEFEDIETHMESLEDTLHDFLGETANIRTALTALRRNTSKNYIFIMVNLILEELRRRGSEDFELSNSVEACTDIIPRRLVRAEVEIEHSDDPEAYAQTFIKGVRELITSHGLSAIFAQE